jgi:hypothetical protein
MSNNAASDLFRIAKILTTAGHPGTSDIEAKNALDTLCRMAGVQDCEEGAVDALRVVYALLDKAGVSFDNMVKPRVVQVPTVSNWQSGSSLWREKEAAEREAKDLKRKLADAQKKIEKLKGQLADAKEESREEKRTSREKQKPQSEAASAANLDGLVSALEVLRKVDPDMRLRTAIALIRTHSAGEKGTTVKELASQIADVSDGAVRYAMRSLGQGWPGKRAGYGLVQDCSDGGRARVYVTTSKGHSVLSDVVAALGKRGTRPILTNLDLKLAA